MANARAVAALWRSPSELIHGQPTPSLASWTRVCQTRTLCWQRKASPSPAHIWRFFSVLPTSLGEAPIRALQRRTPAARMEAMASRFSFGERGSGSGRSSDPREAAGTAPGLDSAFHIVTSGRSGPDGPAWMPWDSPGGVGRVRRHPRPPQLPLPVRRLVSDAAAGRRPRPCRRLPTGGRRRLSGGRRTRIQAGGGNRFLDEPFELSGVHDRAPGVFPQLPKIAISIQFIDMKQNNPSGRGLDEVQNERRIRAEQRTRGRKKRRIRPVGNGAAMM